MIPHYTFTLSLALLFPLAPAFAQPTLGAGSVTPVPGDQLTYSGGLYMDPGPAGANMIWDLSQLSVEEPNLVSYVSPAASGLAATFPNATVAQDLGGTDFLFYRGTATSYEEDGFNTSGYTGTCSDRLTLIEYPLTHNGTYSDNSTCSVTDGSANWARTASITGTADGFGTLVLPWGTVTNVLRVHTEKSLVDNQYTPASLYDNDTYSWYRPGVHGPLLVIDVTVATIFTFEISDSSSTLVDAGAVGVEEAMQHAIGVDLQPNPAVDHVEVIYGLTGGHAVSMELLDLTGQVVRTVAHTTRAAGVQREAIDLAGLAAGPYLVRVTDDTGAFGVKRLVKH